MRKHSKRFIFITVVFVLLIFVLALFFQHINKKYIYKLEYEELIDNYSEKYNIDKYFVCAVIKTESGFDEKATSSVGARGLMQLMPDTFNWIDSKIGENNNISFDDMYIAEYNIEYGTFLLSYLYNRYGSEELVAAAYHAGVSKVDSWLLDPEISDNGDKIEVFPSSVTGHYVNKVMKALESYKNIYET